MGDKDFILVTHKGVLGQKGMDETDVLAGLLHAFVRLWSESIFEIDDERVIKAFMEALEDAAVCKDEDEPEEEDDPEETLLEMLRKMF